MYYIVNVIVDIIIILYVYMVVDITMIYYSNVIHPHVIDYVHASV